MSSNWKTKFQQGRDAELRLALKYPYLVHIDKKNMPDFHIDFRYIDLKFDARYRDSGNIAIELSGNKRQVSGVNDLLISALIYAVNDDNGNEVHLYFRREQLIFCLKYMLTLDLTDAQGKKLCFKTRAIEGSTCVIVNLELLIETYGPDCIDDMNSLNPCDNLM